MITPQLSARTSANGLEGVLRVDTIRRDTLIQLAQAWGDGGRADIEDALDRLAEVLVGEPAEGELDAAVQAVEDAAFLDYPQARLSLRQVSRLRADLAAVEEALSPRPLPTAHGREGGAAA